MKQYLDLCQHILDTGTEKGDRTGTGTYSVFGYQMRFDLAQGFPLLTTKRTAFRLIVSELLWFIKGDTNIRTLIKERNGIWDEWAFERYVKSEAYTGPDMTDFGRRTLKDEEFALVYKAELASFKEKILADEEFANQYGDLGPVYGKQWRAWDSENGVIDQLAQVIDGIKNNPDSRRHIEPSRSGPDGFAALPLTVPILCSRRQVIMPALSTQRRRIPRSTVQHRVVFIADSFNRA